MNSDFLYNLGSADGSKTFAASDVVVAALANGLALGACLHLTNGKYFYFNLLLRFLS